MAVGLGGRAVDLHAPDCDGEAVEPGGQRERPAVDLELCATNQREEVTTPGRATVLLPSRGYGAVRLPDAPGRDGDLQSALDAISVDFSRR